MGDYTVLINKRTGTLIVIDDTNGLTGYPGDLDDLETLEEFCGRLLKAATRPHDSALEDALRNVCAVLDMLGVSSIGPVL